MIENCLLKRKPSINLEGVLYLYEFIASRLKNIISSVSGQTRHAARLPED